MAAGAGDRAGFRAWDAVLLTLGFFVSFGSVGTLRRGALSVGAGVYRFAA